MSHFRRDFIRNTTLTSAGALPGASAFLASSYRKIMGANDRVRIPVVGFSDGTGARICPAL